MVAQKQFLTAAYGGYLKQENPGENVELTHVEKGSLGGELLRRYWQPIALTSEVGDVPLGFRMFGEDLVVFRTTQGEYGILDRHCSHRGTSLEFGLPTEDGLRCCYHGWLFGVDGRVLETPGDPPGSALKDRLFHGAYPVREYKGLIFGYFGPPSSIPEFPVYDSYDYPDDKLVPYCITYPCNWLQVRENVMDPAHAVFLHTRVTFSHFSDTWGELPVMDFVPSSVEVDYRGASSSVIR
jgi:phenylpropionate dioxygenase-like ring-hydroxylating dioxygenase large terminal subunit